MILRTFSALSSVFLSRKILTIWPFSVSKRKPSLRFDDGMPGTCDPHPSPPRQVDRCNHVSVHYCAAFTAPELAFQSFVRLESLPASRTSCTRSSGLTPRQMDNR